MRVAHRVSCLIALLLLNGCDRFRGGHTERDAAQPATWTRATARQLSDAINNRAAHGLDRLRFATSGEPGTPNGDAALTDAALAYASALARGATDAHQLYDP